MTQAITSFITDAGWLAPLYYVASFLISALLPFIPTPLIGALGGNAFGFVPAVLYGSFGLALGAITALTLSQRIGRPVILRLVRPDAWAAWESLLGIRSAFGWGVVFFVLNVDFAVLVAGLSGLPLRSLWIAAMIARMPWLIASAWFGDAVLVSDTVMWVMLILLIPFMWLLRKVQPYLQALVARLSGID